MSLLSLSKNLKSLLHILFGGFHFSDKHNKTTEKVAEYF